MKPLRRIVCRMPRRFKYAALAAVAAAALATSPALAKPLNDRPAPPSLEPYSGEAYYRDLLYRPSDAFNIRPIPTVAAPAPAPSPPKPSLIAEPPAHDGGTNRSLLIGIGLAGAGVVVGAIGALRRRRIAV